MTRKEFISGPAAVLDGAWPGDFADAEEAAYYRQLDDFTPAQAMAALKALRGSKFRPSVGEIVQAIEGTAAAQPTFDEMMAVLFFTTGPSPLCDRPAKRAGRRASHILAEWAGDDVPVGDGDERTLPALTAREQCAQLHPLIGSFVAVQTPERLRVLPVLDEDDGKWVIKDLRVAWNAHVDAMEGRELTALVARSGRGELGRLDPLAALPGRPQGVPALGPGS